MWAEARGKRIFLTGGTGFFGPWLVESFIYANEQLDLGAELVVLTRDPAGARERLPMLKHPSVSLHRGDVRSFEWPAGRFDVVVHGAAESSQQNHVGDHRHMFDTIIDGTRQTLGLARQAGASKYLVLSSGAVYGRQPADMANVPESYVGAPDPTAASSAYGEGKRAAETLAAIEAEMSGLSVRCARCFAFIGPHLPLDIHFAIGNFIRDAIAGVPLRIRGDGTAVRSYLYMSDLAIFLWTLALHESASGAYNVGSNEPISIRETAKVVADVCSPDAAIEVMGTYDPAVPIHRYVPATNRAEQQFDLRARVGLRDAIRRTVEWTSPEFFRNERN